MLSSRARALPRLGPLASGLEAIVLAALFLGAFCFPAPCGKGHVEALCALLFPFLLFDVVFQGRKLGWPLLALAVGFAGLFHWVPASIADKAPMPYPLALLTTLILILWESLGLLGTVMLGRWAFRRFPHQRWLAPCLVAWSIALWELLAMHIYHWHWGAAFGGLPWLARSAAFVGAPGLSAWIWGCGALAAASRQQAAKPLQSTAIALAMGWGIPLTLSSVWFLLPRDATKQLDVIIAQPNFPPRTSFKGMEEVVWSQTDTLLNREKLPRQDCPTLVLWPETAVLERNDCLPNPEVNLAASKRNVAWLYGTDGRDTNGWYNLVRGEAPGQAPFIQAKVHPMHFGERMPGPLWLRAYLDNMMHFSSQSAGVLTPQSTFVFPGPAGPVRVHPLLCSEALLPLRLAEGLQRAGGDLISNHTNDGWFGQSIATDLHAAQLRMRAVEAGLPLLRATLTGKSGFFLANGQWTLWGEPMTKDTYYVPLTWQPVRTPARHPWLYWGLLMGLAAFTLGLWGFNQKVAICKKS